VPLLQACPNGSRTRDEHPSVPLTPEELAGEAAAAVAAGARSLHLHPRGRDGSETLDARSTAAALLAVRRRVPEVRTGVSTAAWIEPDPDRRRAAVAAWEVLPDFASVNLCEAGAPELVAALADRGIGVEAGVWTVADAELLVQRRLDRRCVRLLLEPQEVEPATALGTADAVQAVLDEAGVRTPRLLHGVDGTAWPLLRAAVERGLEARIGLEDVLELPDATPTPDNAALVAAAQAARPR
jgi:uncharacterized protein (DUF849 family)